MTILIDDAGWGCLLGGVVIGAFRQGTQEFVSGVVHTQYFQPPLFSGKTYLVVAATVAFDLLEKLSATEDEPLEICTGYVLNGVETWAKEYRPVTRNKIIGLPQVMTETAFLQELLALGLDVDYTILTQKQGLLFWKCLRWLKGGNIDATSVVPEREKHAKTGWKSYPTWATHTYADAKRLRAQKGA